MSTICCRLSRPLKQRPIPGRDHLLLGYAGFVDASLNYNKAVQAPQDGVAVAVRVYQDLGCFRRCYRGFYFKG